MRRDFVAVQSILYWFKWLFWATIPAGRLLGVPLRVHLLLVLIAPFLGWPFFAMYASGAGALFGAAAAIMYVATLYGSVLAHEFGHAWGNRLVGGHTGMILLTPIGGVAMGSGADLSPRAELIVVALGPAVSVLLAAIGYGAMALMPGQFDGKLELAFWLEVVFVGTINLGLALFNLCFPLFPMDCARLLRAGFSLKYEPGRVTYILCKFGIFLGFFLILAMFLRINVPILGPVSIWLGIIGGLGVQCCLQEMDRIRQMPVYAQQDTWGSKTMYMDGQIIERAKSRAREDLGALIPSGRGGRPRRPPSPTGARVIEVRRAPPVEEISDPSELGRLLREAVIAEDFPLAARIKKRMRTLGGREQD